MFRFFLRSLLLLVTALPWLAVAVLVNGTEVDNWIDFIFGWPRENGTEGGIFPFIVNSFAIVLPAIVLAVTIAVPSALLFQMTTARSVAMRSLIDLGASVPRLVWGVAGSLFFGSLLGLGISAATGILTLTCLLAPILASNFIDSLSVEREKYLPVGRALGLTEWQSWTCIILPVARPAMALAIQAGLAKALSDAAALYLTAGATLGILSSLDAPASTLAVQILMQLLEIGGGGKRAFAISVVLLALVILIQTPLILSRIDNRR
ncbi:hypothetical protein WNZ14_20455 [Hoeflea sp. AS60]|uniref:hypothetical protein n=1 Tax=Hoeflea sp. AS60 TaxID=3135780 RepID=UPI00317E115A